MPNASRALPFVLVATFAALLVGGIALSLATSPPLAEQQLQNAAAATVASPGFVIVVTNSVSNVASAGAASNQPVGSETLRVLYRAPDAVEETLDAAGSHPSVIAIGDRLFQQNGSRWVEAPRQRGVGAKAVATILAPLRLAVHATHVIDQGGVYRFSSPDFLTHSRAVLGVDASELSSPQLTASVRGGLVTRETITALIPDQRLALDLVFSAIGTAPPVQVPPLGAGQP